LLFALIAGHVGGQSTDASRVVALINQTRLDAGLTPLAVNLQLAAAAQAHADDMSRHGLSIGHSGSDGSTPATRILRAGYHSYTWGPFVGENWAAYQSVDDSMSAWLNDPLHRKNILRKEFREIGIGVVSSPSAAPILVADFGAQPDVLPVFLNGAGATVLLLLTNEDAAPEGDGSYVIGRAVSVEISTDAAFSRGQEMPFAGSIPYSSGDGRPVSTLYVRYRDAQGRTAVSTASAVVEPILPRALPTTTSTFVPSTTPRPTRRAVATRTWTPLRPAIESTPAGNARIDKGRGYSSESATPTASQTMHLRQALAASDPAKTQAASSAGGSIFTLLAEGLEATAGVLLLLAVVRAWQVFRS
jgi:hypothetical protein